MKKFKYNMGLKAKGLYCDLGGIGQCYNVQLFLESFSRNKTGEIRVSSKRFPSSIKLDRLSNNGWNVDYETKEKKLKFRLVSFDPMISKAKTVYVKVTPTKR